jgi:tight adherence protein C
MLELLNVALFLLTFAVIAILSLALILRLDRGVNVSRRMAGQDKLSKPIIGTGTLLKADKTKSLLTGWIEKTSSLADTKTGSDLSRALQAAGFHGANAPALFIAIRFGFAIAIPVLFLWLQPSLLSEMARPQASLFALFLTAIGLIAPRAIIDNLAGRRKQQLIDAFPDALDLMVVCVEAGLGMEAAFVRVAQELRASRPLLSQELSWMGDELRAGRSRAEALRNLATRCDVPSITAFTTLMIQSDSLGSSVGRTLRVYSTEMRANRAIAAEEKAMRIPVLLTIPLVACILPVIATALLLPAVLLMKDILPE